jgi:hypothetical protein
VALSRWDDALRADRLYVPIRGRWQRVDRERVHHVPAADGVNAPRRADLGDGHRVLAMTNRVLGARRRGGSAVPGLRLLTRFGRAVGSDPCLPGGADDLVDGVPHPPVQIAGGELTGGDDPVRVALSARADLGGEVDAGDPLASMISRTERPFWDPEL